MALWHKKTCLFCNAYPQPMDDMNTSKIRKKPKILLVEPLDYIYELLKLTINPQGKWLFELLRVDGAQEAFALIKEGEQFDAVIFSLDGWIWLPSFFSFEIAEEIKRLNDNIPIIASMCCNSCFDSQRIKEMKMYVLPNGGFFTSMTTIKKALRECGVLSE